MSTSLVSVVLVNWNTRALTEDAIASLLRFEKNVPLEIILVDNASSDDSVPYFQARYPDIRILHNAKNFGFARANNQGAAAASGRYVLLLNTDTRFTQEVLPSCLAAMSGGPAIVGCRLLNADGTLQLSAEAFPNLWKYFRETLGNTTMAHARKLRQISSNAAGSITVDWLCGAFLLIERDLYLQLGGLSEQIFMYGEDTEFCWRARKHGIPSLYVPDVSIIHLGGGGVDHASFRSLALSDSGRLRAFTIMRGRVQAMALRGIFMTRSAVRVVFFLLLAGDKKSSRPRARNHFREFLVLMGVVDARNPV